MDVPVGFGALGKNWKIQATSRNDMAMILMALPAFPRLNREGGKGSLLEDACSLFRMAVCNLCGQADLHAMQIM